MRVPEQILRRLPPVVRDLVELTEAKDAIAEGIAALMAEISRLRLEVLELRAGRPRKGPLDPRPRWDLMRVSAAALDDVIRDSGPGGRAQADMNAAWIRDHLDALGLSIRHEDTLYSVIVGATTVLDMQTNALRQGHGDEHALRTTAGIVQALVGSVLDYLPASAR